MAATRRFGERFRGLPRALWRRAQHQAALWQARAQSRTRVRERRPQRLLVMCYGNIYRSPFVATWLDQQLTAVTGFEIRSAGFHPVAARPSPPAYVLLARHYRIDLEAHRSRLVQPDDLSWADAIVIMDRYNWERLQGFGDAVRAKIVWLGAFTPAGPVEIEDPYALPPARVQAIVEQMCAAADGLVRQLRASPAQPGFSGE